MGNGFGGLLFVCLSAFVTCSGSSFADSPETSGKTVTVYVGSAAGSGYDAYARFFARHLGRHLPGRPSVVVANMPGANSIVCANFLYNVAPKDGSALAILLQNVAEGQVIGHDGIRYDAAGFGWVGRLAPNVEINYVWHTVPVKSIDDLRQRETVYAAVGTGTASAIVYPTLLNAISGTRIKLVRGYQGTPNVHLAMERGEVEGVTGSLGAIMTSAPEYLTAKKVRLIMQYQFERSRDLPDVPAVMELIQAPADRELFGFFLNSANIGRSILAPPGLSRERLEALRRAFSETMRDPEFIAEMAHGKLDLSPLAGSDLQLIVRRQVEASPELKASIHAIQWKQ